MEVAAFLETLKRILLEIDRVEPLGTRLKARLCR